MKMQGQTMANNDDQRKTKQTQETQWQHNDQQRRTMKMQGTTIENNGKQRKQCKHME